jgi:hypothetical protein
MSNFRCMVGRVSVQRYQSFVEPSTCRTKGVKSPFHRLSDGSDAPALCRRDEQISFFLWPRPAGLALEELPDLQSQHITRPQERFSAGASIKRPLCRHGRLPPFAHG